jgi:tetratricopeptide (TPR) repeat protein
MTDVRKDRWRQVRRYFALLKASIGIACCSILIIAAIVGVIRGYSVQSEILWFLPSILLFWAIFYFPRKESFIQGLKDSFKPSLENLFYAVFLVYILIGCLHGRHYFKGYEFYEQGLYCKAAMEFEKETQLWYLKLGSNSSEPSAMQKLAESYCQLEEFDKAECIYKLILSRYQGVDYDMASLSLQRLKDGLQSIARYKEDKQGLQNDFSKLHDIANVYESDLNCDKKAVDIYRTITQMNISAEDKRDAYDAILRLTTIKYNNH